MKIRKAMVLAAGEGTRLRPLTDTRPKPTVPVLDRPLIGHTLGLLARFGVEEVGVNLHHLPERMKETVGDGSRFGLRVHYSFEEALLGTAGAVKKMEPLFDEDFFVIYGDNFLNIDLQALADLHAARGADAVIGLFHAADPSACGIVERDDEGRVTRFVEKPTSESVRSDAANAGVYSMSPRILREIPPGEFSDFGRDIFPALLERGRSVYAGFVRGYLEDIGTFDRYKKVCFDVLDGLAGSGVDIATHGGAFIDDGVRADGAALGRHTVLSRGTAIGPASSVRSSVLWERCRVGSRAVVEESILADECEVADEAQVIDSVLGAGSTIGGGARVAGCVLPVGSHVESGAQMTRSVEEQQIR